MNHITRRHALAMLGSAGLAAPFVAAARAQSGSKTLVVASLGGSFEEAQRKTIFEPFQTETGIQVRVVAYTSPSQMIAQEKTGNIEWDAVLISRTVMLSLQKEGYLEKLDHSRVAKADLDGLQPKSLVTDYGIPNIFFTRGLAYNTKILSEGQRPRNWTDVWDTKKVPGQRSLGAFVGTLTPDLEFALLADGVPIDKLYPLDVDRAFGSLDKIRSSVAKFWTTGAMSPQLLTDGEVSVASAYANRIGDVIASGAPLAFEWNQGMLQVDHWCILKGAKNYDNAMRFIAFATKADVQAALSNINLLGPANVNAFKSLSKERVQLLPTAPDSMQKQFIYDDEWWAANFTPVQRRWEQWSLTR